MKEARNGKGNEVRRMVSIGLSAACQQLGIGDIEDYKKMKNALPMISSA